MMRGRHILFINKGKGGKLKMEYIQYNMYRVGTNFRVKVNFVLELKLHAIKFCSKQLL